MSEERERGEAARAKFNKGMSKLKTRGGKGEEGVGMIDGSVLTLKETIAVQIARDVLDDAKRATKKEIQDIPLLTLAQYAKGRSKGRPVTDEAILREVCRLQNHEKYGNKVARR